MVWPTWDQTLGSLLPALDNTLRQCGGCPSYWPDDDDRHLLEAAGAEQLPVVGPA